MRRRILSRLVAWVLPDNDYWDWDPAGVQLDEAQDDEPSALDTLDVDVATTADQQQMQSSDVVT